MCQVLSEVKKIIKMWVSAAAMSGGESSSPLVSALLCNFGEEPSPLWASGCWS